MAKKTAKRTVTAAKITAAEVAAQREAATLRRLRNQQRGIVALSRQLTSAVRRADIVRISAARELVEGTEWGVYGHDEYRRAVDQLANAKDEIAELERALTTARNGALATDREALASGR